MRKFLWLACTLILAVVAASCGQKSEPPAETPSQPVARAHVQNRMLKQWMMGLMARRLTMSETKASRLGSGAMEVDLGADGLTWQESADVDSNGTTETVGFLWDDTNKVLYAFTADPITLDDGSVADKGLMVSQFGEGNTKARVAGSGWYAYAIERDTTATGEVHGRLFGCTFDNFGTELECGEGTWERTANEFILEVTPL
jgi:hypothetical protein